MFRMLWNKFFKVFSEFPPKKLRYSNNSELKLSLFVSDFET